jgi:hypothetical protein
MEIKIEKDSLIDVLTLLLEKTEIDNIIIKLKPNKKPIKEPNLDSR